MARLTLEQRFHSKYQPVPWTGCWIWTAATKERGYGVIGLGSRKEGIIKAHRLSYILHKGQIPEDKVVMHKCNNPLCVNPDHLESGTRKENQQYMVHCGRLVLPDNKGEKASRSKLTEDAAKEIIDAFATKKKGTGTVLAKKFNVSKSTVYQIWGGSNWKHLR